MVSEIKYNGAAGRYEQTVDGLTVFARVRREGGILYIDYVEAPPALRGTGAAGRFMEGLMQVVRSEKIRVIPVCGYAAAWLQRHPEYDALRAN